MKWTARIARIFRGEEELHIAFWRCMVPASALFFLLLDFGHGVFFGIYTVILAVASWCCLCLIGLSRCWHNSSRQFIEESAKLGRIFFAVWFGALLILPLFYLMYVAQDMPRANIP